ncbi:hypothetical protein B0H14DRAFT_2599969 [Mycena olivaceomarginata]|nr:hypothetical protein B0H14DRAFT_2599969 [Mycena olivaceomarginata]
MGNGRTSSGNWAHMERVSRARRERGAAKIEHRVVRNKRTWGGDQARGRRVRSTRVSAIENKIEEHAGKATEQAGGPEATGGRVWWRAEARHLCSFDTLHEHPGYETLHVFSLSPTKSSLTMPATAEWMELKYQAHVARQPGER